MVPNGTDQDSILLPEMYGNKSFKETVRRPFKLIKKNLLNLLTLEKSLKLCQQIFSLQVQNLRFRNPTQSLVSIKIGGKNFKSI